jgi:hypothetical protein
MGQLAHDGCPGGGRLYSVHQSALHRAGNRTRKTWVGSLVCGTPILTIWLDVLSIVSKSRLPSLAVWSVAGSVVDTPHNYKSKCLFRDLIFPYPNNEMQRVSFFRK